MAASKNGHATKRAGDAWEIGSGLRELPRTHLLGSWVSKGKKTRSTSSVGLVLVMRGMIFNALLYLEKGVRTDEQEERLTSRRRWRSGTTGACCTGWRSPTLDRSCFAGPNIFAIQDPLGLLSGATSIDFREPPFHDVRE